MENALRILQKAGLSPADVAQVTNEILTEAGSGGGGSSESNGTTAQITVPEHGLGESNIGAFIMRQSDGTPVTYLVGDPMRPNTPMGVLISIQSSTEITVAFSGVVEVKKKSGVSWTDADLYQDPMLGAMGATVVINDGGYAEKMGEDVTSAIGYALEASPESSDTVKMFLR